MLVLGAIFMSNRQTEIEKIREIVHNLGIENIELRTRESPDVAPYLPPVDFEWLEINCFIIDAYLIYH